MTVTAPPAAPTLPALVSDIAGATPDAAALVAGAVEWTYRELDDAARRAAAALRGLGVGPGGTVALLGANSAQWLAATLGAMRAGARVDAFNTWVKAWDLRHLLATCAAPVLVMDAAVRSSDLLAELRELVPELWDAGPGEWRSAEFPVLREVVVLDHSVDHCLAADLPAGARRWSGLTGGPGADTCAAGPDDVAFVLYTSGSTRHPKAVPLRQHDLLVNGFHIGERMGLTAADRVWLGSPLFWSFGAANALPATLTHGACLVVQDHFDPATAADTLAAHRCTAAYLLPSLADGLATVADRVRAVTSLRTGLTIGRPDEVRRIVDELDVPDICNIYGSTETYGNCCVTPHDAPLEVRLTTQGPPLPGVELRVVDVDGTELPPGEFGELQVRGRVMPGYLGDDDETAATNAAALTADGWYRTGDRLRVRAEDGFVEFGARLTDMIKTNGINVAPAEVEGFLSAHPDVAEVAVVGAPHRSRGEVVVAFATLVDGAAATGEDLRRFCRNAIAGYKVPWEVVVLEALPRTGTGKVTRRALVEQAAERVRSREREGAPG
ncbi:Long-chain-fatty-acid--CoA ligase [Pseudonocardia dioxanivorans CB1190]|uniref:Long-chain-fatty-acid--CoA ligase n=1 Tax=Pseudonocardia dioxanivorans (strain ATCC 55486 / DSM 44775 / JCM 13855 / CB1190) TaxID=675635 RepID=F4CJQ0_PSEUX|nr:AMP-binding protein [Pseudonocardia dioxanivorans]AEA25910.1 Long-chain-fatty-acid--CoA ligase [Pseudonocardia dioxanivorans CB1190]GJF06331.1 AMP-binding protein [Pseudonocardia sp. D17]